MKNRDKAISALLAVFPTRETFIAFAEKRENADALSTLLEYGKNKAILPSGQAEELEDFVGRHARSPEECQPPAKLTFETLIDEKEKLLKINLSVRAMTDRIATLLADAQIDLPKVSNSMLTRLKKEPADTDYKQNVLRSLAFWIGHERGGSGSQWNYETLLKLCRKSKPTEHNYREGVRIGFALYSRGEVIDHEIVGWLKKTLKEYIEKSIGHFSFGRWGKVRSHDITTLYVDFPKEDKKGYPTAYRPCLRSAVSLAHQIALRWDLSKYRTKNRFLAIGIAAGEYATLDNYLLPTLNAKLPGDPAIRLTDYVRQCLLINDIHAILCERPHETTLFNGEALSIWWIVGFWSNLYFDFIPELLEDPILKNDAEAAEALVHLLYFPEKETDRTAENKEPNAVTTFFRFPHNALLGIEIAKTLYYRRRFREALEILRIVTSINPTDITARTLAMILLRNMALDAPSYPISSGMLHQAELVALYIEKNCVTKPEDFYCEYSVVHLVKAMQALKFSRLGRGYCDGQNNPEETREDIIAALNMAELLLGKGITVSPLPIRSFYLLTSVKILKAVLLNDDEIFTNPHRSLNGSPEKAYQPSIELQWQIDNGSDGRNSDNRYDFLRRLTITRSEIHDDSVFLEAYRPTTYFCHAVSLWDFMPIKHVATAKRALRMLRDARKIAQTMTKYDICIYSFTRTYGEMIPVEEFIQHIDRSIVMLEEKTGDDLYTRPDSEILNIQEDLTSLLLTLNCFN